MCGLWIVEKWFGCANGLGWCDMVWDVRMVLRYERMSPSTEGDSASAARVGGVAHQAKFQAGPKAQPQLGGRPDPPPSRFAPGLSPSVR
jgi:hypothetical protein